MKKIKFSITTVIIISLILFSLSSCTQKSNNSNPESDESILILSKIATIETEIIGIMNQVDLIPYFEKQIEEKKSKEEEKKQMEILTGKKGGEGNNSEQKSEEDGETFKPEPITIDDILLLKITEKESPDIIEEQKEKEIPDDILFIWHDINNNIDKLNVEWDDFKPKLMQKDIPTNAVIGFEKTLNGLTISGAERKYMETLLKTNTLTSYIPQFITNPKDKTSASIYNIKYYLRQIILDIASNNNETITNNLTEINTSKEKLIAKLKEKKFAELAEKLKLSISSLESAILEQDLNLIKIKTSIVMKNVRTVKEKLGL